MKMLVCTLTMRIPVAALEAEGNDELTIGAEFEALGRELKEEAPDGTTLAMHVTTEDV